LADFLFSLCGDFGSLKGVVFLPGDCYDGFLCAVSVQPMDRRGRIFLMDEDVLGFLPTTVL
jgi:hypothetical protein